MIFLRNLSKAFCQKLVSKGKIWNNKSRFECGEFIMTFFFHAIYQKFGQKMVSKGKIRNDKNKFECVECMFLDFLYTLFLCKIINLNELGSTKTNQNLQFSIT